MSYPDRLIDKRVVERYIRKGMVDKAQYQSLIEALPDMEHNAATALEEEEAAGDEAEEAEEAPQASDDALPPVE